MKRAKAALFVAMAIGGTFFAAGSTSADNVTYFVIGADNAAEGSHVEYWGAQWSKLNSVGGGRAPASFKGFADVVTVNPEDAAGCSGTFETRPGNSSSPPATVGSTVVVLVANSISKSGDVISGTFSSTDTVATNPGYGADPGHAGTGTVTGIACNEESPV